MLHFIKPNQICNFFKIPVSISGNLLQQMTEIIYRNDIDYKIEINNLLNNYKKNISSNISNLYQINCEILETYKAANIFLPWLHSKPTRDKDAFFSIFDNYQYLDKEIKIIKELLNSIEEKGYIENFDQSNKPIFGYYLIKNNEKKFYVQGGNHRVAVLSLLHPEKDIPIHLIKRAFNKVKNYTNTNLSYKLNPYKKIVYEEHHKFPSVTSKFINSEVAKLIFNKYFNNEQKIK